MIFIHLVTVLVTDYALRQKRTSVLLKRNNPSRGEEKLLTSHEKASDKVLLVDFLSFRHRRRYRKLASSLLTATNFKHHLA